ncbi:DUF4158 domain-containing protein [Hymenobacter sp. PAMC29290]|nr:DUF4158 domain-containing protein [Hymenobacter siberiensis]
MSELQAAFGFQTFGLPHYRAAVTWLAEVARQTDKGVVLVQALMRHLRRRGASCYPRSPSSNASARMP